MKTIDYYFSPQSPWSYLGHDRLLSIATRYGAAVQPRPFALTNAVFPVSGGLPLKQRAPQRQAYRLVELKRWSDYLGVPLNIHPKHFPVANDEPASLMIAAAIQHAGNDAALHLIGAVFRAVWVEDRNLLDSDTLIQLANECGLDGASLYEAREHARQLYDENT